MATWNIDPTHSEVQFKVRHLMISTVTGQFKQFEGGAETSGDSFEGANINFAAHVNSIDTNMEMRDTHLKSADFFDAENHPTINFSGVLSGNKLNGELNIRGAAHPVSLNVEHLGDAVDFYGNHKAGFELSGSINRKDFGLGWHAVTEAGNVVVSDEVKLHFNIQLAKQA